MVKLHRLTILWASSAGAVAAETLRHGDFDGTVVLVGEEPVGPYEFPPLSEGHPPGEIGLDTAAVHSAPLSRDQHVSLSTSTTVGAIDLVTDTISALPGVDLSYDHPPLATDVAPRAMPIPGATLPWNHRLCSLVSRGRLEPAQPSADHPAWNRFQSDGFPGKHVTEALL
jgi:3-phenylpropionate/trans-cinnamate dioxygenase ferredoxin reductase subunit